MAAVRLQPLETSRRRAVARDPRPETAGDVLVLAKRDGKSLDYVEGVLGDVTADKIEFKLDGETAAASIATKSPASFTSVAAMHAAARAALRAPRPHWPASQRCRRCDSTDGVLHINDRLAARNSTGRWTSIHLADFSAGKIRYLSDLEPASTSAGRRSLALPAGASAGRRVWRSRAAISRRTAAR